MWKLASHATRRRLRPSRETAWIAAGCGLTTAALVWNDDSHGNGLPEPVRRTAMVVSSCEPLTAHFSHLRRQQTIQKMQKTSAKVTLKERYKVDWKNPLGQGSFGCVYNATDRKTGERVAVKKISKTLTDNVAFQREMDALLHLRQAGGHPNICGLRENFDEGGFYYLVLDHISGGEMFETLCSQGAYSEADAARLIREAACALDFCHGIEVVHGDLKPENLMLSSEHSSDAAIKVVDFGCAQVTHGDLADVLISPVVANTKQKNKGVARTPAYCPPEILEMKHSKTPQEGRRIQPSFDMWALGVILYIMLTGVHPFDLYGNSTDEEIEQQIMARKLPPLRNSPLTAHLSDDAISLIEQLLQWDADKRLTAFQVLENPWVRGETARTDKMANSDKRLSKYRAFKSKLEATVFANMVSLAAQNGETSEVDNRMSLIEHAFHKLDPGHKGYVTTTDLQKMIKQPPSGVPSDANEDEQLSLSGFAGLMAETMKNRYYPKGHIIYHEGEIGDVMFFLSSGAIEVSTKDGFSKVLRKPGDYFGEGALIDPTRIRSASIRCVTPVHAIEVNREYFEKYMASDYDLKLNLREMNKSRKRQRANALLQLQKSLEEKVALRNEYIFTENAPGDELYILEEGRVDTTLKGLKVFSVWRRGDIFGESSLIFGRTRNVAAQCKSDECKLHVLRSRDFHTFVDSHPSMKESIRDMCLRREFQKAVCFMTQKPFPENEKDLRKVFDAVDRKKSGKLELQNIRNLIKRLDKRFTENQIRDILKTMDIDESGVVCWEEFKRLFEMEFSGKK